MGSNPAGLFGDEYELRIVVEVEDRMIQTIEAIIDESGAVRLLESVHVPSARRALVMVLDEAPGANGSEITLLSEPALADWSRPEEDAAWSHLQSAK